MDLEFTADELKFRDEVRTWISEVLTDDLKQRMALSKNGSLDEVHQKAWQKQLAKKGWLATNWPVEHGGTGWTQTQKYIFEMECALAGTPRMSSMGIRMCAPVIMKFGTDAQKEKFLPPIRNSDVWWCQGYSEPGAGSDLAWPVDERPSARATTTSSTAPRRGPPTPSGPTGFSASSAPRRKTRSSRASPSSSST